MSIYEDENLDEGSVIKVENEILSGHIYVNPTLDSIQISKSQLLNICIRDTKVSKIKVSDTTIKNIEIMDYIYVDELIIENCTITGIDLKDCVIDKITVIDSEIAELSITESRVGVINIEDSIIIGGEISVTNIGEYKGETSRILGSMLQKWLIINTDINNIEVRDTNMTDIEYVGITIKDTKYIKVFISDIQLDGVTYIGVFLNRSKIYGAFNRSEIECINSTISGCKLQNIENEINYVDDNIHVKVMNLGIISSKITRGKINLIHGENIRIKYSDICDSQINLLNEDDKVYSGLEIYKSTLLGVTGIGIKKVQKNIGIIK